MWILELVCLHLNPGFCPLLSAVRQVTGIIFASVFFIQDVLTWTIFKVFVTILRLVFCCCFVLFFFWPGGTWDLSSSSRELREPVPPSLEGEVLTTGLPGKTLLQFFLTSKWELKYLTHGN